MVFCFGVHVFKALVPFASGDLWDFDSYLNTHLIWEHVHLLYCLNTLFSIRFQFPWGQEAHGHMCMSPRIRDKLARYACPTWWNSSAAIRYEEGRDRGDSAHFSIPSWSNSPPCLYSPYCGPDAVLSKLTQRNSFNRLSSPRSSGFLRPSCYRRGSWWVAQLRFEQTVQLKSLYQLHQLSETHKCTVMLRAGVSPPLFLP